MICSTCGKDLTGLAAYAVSDGSLKCSLCYTVEISVVDYAKSPKGLAKLLRVAKGFEIMNAVGEAEGVYFENGWKNVSEDEKKAIFLEFHDWYHEKLYGPFKEEVLRLTPDSAVYHSCGDALGAAIRGLPALAAWGDLAQRIYKHFYKERA